MIRARVTIPATPATIGATTLRTIGAAIIGGKINQVGGATIGVRTAQTKGVRAFIAQTKKKEM